MFSIGKITVSATFGIGVLLGAAGAKAQMCEPVPGAFECAPLACSTTEDDHCAVIAAQLDTSTGGIVAVECACMPADGCHLEMLSDGPGAVGACPSGQSCTLSAWDSDNDGVHDRLSAECASDIGTCCFDIDDGPIAYDTCIESDEASCHANGGLFHVVDVACDAVEACCFTLAGASDCVDMNPLCCAASGGVPQGPGSTCANVDPNIVCPRICGGLAGIPCEEGEFCHFPIGTCEIADRQGVCRPLAEICYTLWDPVCGCDGVTYGNECEAHVVGMSIEHPGPCESECRPTDDGFGCVPAPCSDIPEDMCMPSVLHIDWSTGAITAVVCECIDFNFCHIEFGNATPFAVGYCPGGGTCEVVGTDTDNDGIDDQFWAQCAHTGACCVESTASPFPVPGCVETTPDMCDNASFLGVGTTCEFTEACCLPAIDGSVGGLCVDTLPECCVRFGGVPRGHRWSCAESEFECGQTCGGFASIPCASNGEFCKLPEGQCCCDRLGICTPYPGGCPDVWDPVCGCDGRTYGNECEADAAGVSIDHHGECEIICRPADDGFGCTPLACSMIPEEQCLIMAIGTEGTTNPLTTIACECMDFNLCHIEYVYGGPIQVVGNCPNGGTCELVGHDEDGDGVHDYFTAECISAGVCCFDMGGAPFPVPICYEMTPDECKAEHGFFGGHDTTCDIVEACCLGPAGDGLCVDAHPRCCMAFGGIPQGPGSSCADPNFSCARVCGGIAGIPCNDGEFCQYPHGTCHIADRQGVCQPIPSDCPRLWDPVCGCDGVTYPNECEAHAADMSVDYPGECMTGACCMPPTAGLPPCFIATREACYDAGGAYQGEGTTCPPDPSMPCGPPIGACCLPSGTAPTALCDMMTAEECFERDGEYLGDWTPCPGPNEPCGTPTGACCLRDPNGVFMCIETTEQRCLEEGGTHVGIGTTCPEDPAELCGPFFWACCMPDGRCYEVPEEYCLAIGGEPIPGASCDVVFCGPPHPGICCEDISDGPIPYETCHDVPDPEACRTAGGIFHPDSVCEQTEACCFGSALDLCEDLNPFCCLDSGGVPQGWNTSCADVTCGEVCGGIAGIPCDDPNEFCKFPTATCGEYDIFGVCTIMPEGCPEYYDPVCGCDGVTYGNECEADAAGVSIAYWGECKPRYCWSHDMCEPNEYCFLDGCLAETGVCVPRPEACPDIWEPVCGCDGVTYPNACEAARAGMSVDYAGVCETLYCWSNDMCAPDQYCFFHVCAVETGVCMPRPEDCPDVWDPVCGCDGVTYPNGCEAARAGMSVDHYGECERICGGLGPYPPCSSDEFCKFPLGACYDSTVLGVCVPIPEACPEYYEPVCGCDGRTYDNECFADMASVSLDYFGVCEVPACAATRSLADPDLSYCPGAPKFVQIHLSPREGATSYALEDSPPAGWTVSDISGDGVFDSVHWKVKWGPFFAHNFPRSVSYVVTPTEPVSVVACFAGTISIDGINEEICGDDCIDSSCCPHMGADKPQPACPWCLIGDCTTCPEGRCQDGRISMCELIGYACAWLLGCNDDLAGMTRAAYIWRNGECYCWDAGEANWFPSSCPSSAPWCCDGTDPGGNASEPASTTALGGASASIRSVSKSRTSRVRELKVPITIEAPAGASAVALELHVPRGWNVTAISDGGGWDESSRKVKWGPFMDDLSRTVTFKATRTGGAMSPKTDLATDATRPTRFRGTVSFDGVNQPIAID